MGGALRQPVRPSAMVGYIDNRQRGRQGMADQKTDSRIIIISFDI